MAGHEDNTLDAETLALFANAPERFVRKLRREGGCVVWCAGKDKDGYGQHWVSGPNQKRAHRWAYEWHYGPISGGVLMHTCDRRECVNPTHLIHGTQTQNRMDCVQKGRHAFGGKMAAAKLTPETVRAIREEKANGMTQRALAKKYGVDPKSIWCAVHKISWSFV